MSGTAEPRRGIAEPGGDAGHARPGEIVEAAHQPRRIGLHRALQAGQAGVALVLEPVAPAADLHDLRVVQRPVQQAGFCPPSR